MFQHTDGHALSGTHGVIDTETGEEVQCTSTHHQMMRAGDDAQLLGVASEARSVESMVGTSTRIFPQKRGEDVEVLYYSAANALCFQPHPEMLSTASPCQQWYFELINQHLFGGK